MSLFRRDSLNCPPHCNVCRIRRDRTDLIIQRGIVICVLVMFAVLFTKIWWIFQ